MRKLANGASLGFVMASILFSLSSSSGHSSVARDTRIEWDYFQRGRHLYYSRRDESDDHALEEAINLLKKAVESAPSFALPHYFLSRALLESGEKDLARVTLSTHLTDQGVLLSPVKYDRSYTAKNVLPCSTRPLAVSKLPSTVHVVTVATRLRPAVDALRESVRKAGLGDLTVLGLGNEWTGHGLKLTLPLKWLRTIPSNDLVLFVDAYDVVLLGPAEDIARRFVQGWCDKVKVVFGAETNPYPDGPIELVLPETYVKHTTGLGLSGQENKPGEAAFTPYPFLNSGQYIGRAKHVKQMLQRVQRDFMKHWSRWMLPEQADDQRLLWRYHLSHPHEVVVDLRGEIFQTLHDTPASDFEVVLGDENAQITDGEGRWSGVGLRNIRTRQTPILLHGNGQGNGLVTLNTLVKRVHEAEVKLRAKGEDAKTQEGRREL